MQGNDQETNKVEDSVNEKNLGLGFKSNISWKSQIYSGIAKANKMIGML